MLGESAEGLKNTRAIFRGLKLLLVETPRKDTGQGLEERAHRGGQATPWGAVFGHSAPREEESKDDQKPCHSKRMLQRFHGLSLLEMLTPWPKPLSCSRVGIPRSLLPETGKTHARLCRARIPFL